MKLAPRALIQINTVNLIMSYSNKFSKTKICPLHQNFNIVSYFALIGDLYIET